MFLEIHTIATVIFIMSICSVTMYRKQLLLILLIFEIMGLSIFICLFYMYATYTHFLSSSLYMLITAVCEASLGISLLVVLTRAWGNDKMQNL
uniref:NADH-ubiquinone oxidoreductase chain 4L n=1 Tax=Celleporella hyalina TaxID=60593 RepID=I6Q0X2_9BILA|nr:NADH dehydrogenase subunit 4L [Celleporella hyalina]AFJ53897.1 NADH dehydrogenase subunit 4L [Celleporella hyalina]